MLFELPSDILSIILGFLNPDDLQNLQCTTRDNLLQLYRIGHKYTFAGTEKFSFYLFREKFFMKHLYRFPQKVPPGYKNSLSHPRPGLLNMVHCRGLNESGRIVMSIHMRQLQCSRSDFESFGDFLGTVVHARNGTIEQLVCLNEERDLAVALVQQGLYYPTRELMAKYKPQTTEMVKCLLHFGLVFPVERSLLTQELCDFWFLRTPIDSQKWLVNNLPDHISVTKMIEHNAIRFLSLANKKTIVKYGIIEDRENWTKRSAFFFPSLLSRRRKCGLTLSDLTGLSNMHIILHGRICHLLTSNVILQKSPLYRPSFSVLEQGARRGDPFFRVYVNRLLFLPHQEIRALYHLAVPNMAMNVFPVQPYIFSDKNTVPTQDIESILKAAFRRNCDLVTRV